MRADRTRLGRLCVNPSQGAEERERNALSMRRRVRGASPAWSPWSPRASVLLSRCVFCWDDALPPSSVRFLCVNVCVSVGTERDPQLRPPDHHTHTHRVRQPADHFSIPSRAALHPPRVILHHNSFYLTLLSFTYRTRIDILAYKLLSHINEPLIWYETSCFWTHKTSVM